MPHLTIAIPDELAAELRDLAHDAYRDPRDQATVLLIEAIRRAAAERAREGITPIDGRSNEQDDRPTAAWTQRQQEGPAMTRSRVGSEYTPPDNACVGDGGVFPVTLIGIGEERDSDGQFGPEVVQEWRFAIDDPTSPFDGQLLWDSWVTAPKDGQVHPKSDHYGYMTALFGGRTAPEGTEIDIEMQLVGRQALATVVRRDDGSMRITDLGALPTQAVAAAPVQQQPRAAAQQAPALREQVAAAPAGDLPF